MSEQLLPQERIILAIDVSEESEAERLCLIAQEAGARAVKLGTEVQSIPGWGWTRCSELAARHELGWVADAKLNDIPNTVAKTVRNIARMEHPPFAITMHTTSGIEAMRAAQEEAGSIKILGVTVLTSIDEKESNRIYRVPPRTKVIELAHDAVVAGIEGVVASPEEVDFIKRHRLTQNLFTMIPGTRSIGANTQDQARVRTPAEAIRDGADLLVIGRQITQADDPSNAYEQLVKEIEGAM